MPDITKQAEHMTLEVTSEPSVTGIAGERTVQFRYADVSCAQTAQPLGVGPAPHRTAIKHV